MYNAIVGNNDHLINYLKSAIKKANLIRFNLAFLMESGAKLITPFLIDAAKRDVEIKILTGKYMKITEPSAIYYLKSKLEDNLDIRFYEDDLYPFHPKSYIFDYSGEAEVFIGSSNLSLSALTTGIEWNYRFYKSNYYNDYNKISNTFNDLFYKHSEVITSDVLKKYTSSWKKSVLINYEQKDEIYTDEQKVEPIGAQIEALYELKNAREEGIKKGLVVAATGVGKTYLAAFDSINHKKILFLAHREEILIQAEKTFKNVRDNVKTGFYIGNKKDSSADIYFASVQTFAKNDNLKKFNNKYFDYIVVDEFHHAAANSYLKILKYFEPEFLLGLTATPYRMDNRDIYSLCNDNVIYELYIKDAINRGLLVPFKYFGIYDYTDYDQITYKNGNYVIKELEYQLSRKERANHVLNKYKKFAKKRTIGFCASINHAEYMAKYFKDNNISAVAVHSGNQKNKYVMNRIDAIKNLEEEKINVIFVVDIFNEGVDLPSLDTVMFLRPTESYIVFLQQLGRGLRKNQEKSYLTVLDFIGNYKKAHYVPAILAGDNPMDPKNIKRKVITEFDFPEDCQVQFDFKVLDLFEEMSKHDPLKKRMQEDFFRIKNILGGRPERIDIYERSDIPFREYRKKGWLQFLNNLDELNSEEKQWLGTEIESFLKYLEKTSMSKSYKIPTIDSFIKDNNISKEVSLSKIAENFMLFYKNNKLHQKDLNNKSNKNWNSWELEQFLKIAKKNPVKFLSKSKYFNYDEINKKISLMPELEPYLSSLLLEHVKDILELRRIDYFRKRYKNEE